MYPFWEHQLIDGAKRGAILNINFLMPAKC
jgi:hypothetical protein